MDKYKYECLGCKNFFDSESIIDLWLGDDLLFICSTCIQIKDVVKTVDKQD